MTDRQLQHVQPSKPPPSCTSFSINLVGLGFMFVGLWVLSLAGSTLSKSHGILFILAFTLMPILALEFLFRRPALIGKLTGFQVLKRANLERVAIKLLALYSIFLAIAFFYWLLPEYWGDFYQPFWNLLLPALPWLIVLAIPYFVLIDALDDDPQDEYYQLGCFLLFYRPVNRNAIRQLLLGWLVKSFFLPLMIVYLGNNIDAITSGQFSFERVILSFRNFYDWMFHILLIIDLTFVSIGYCATFRLIDSNIRSTEPTMLGWSVALICYEPFASRIFSLYTEYEQDGLYWGFWLSGNEVLYMIWGTLILALLIFYALASVAFGHRFSNLTHRGIITNGPYRYSKHPAYLSKNLSWWLISIPFVSATGDIELAVKSCLLLVLVNIVYYLRARTEERHLSKDPVYREYAEWVDTHGIVAVLRRNLLRPFARSRR